MSDTPTTATERLSSWLTKFDAALAARDIAAAVDLFAEQSYWRDLVSFTWNIKTMEGRDAIGAMLAATLERVAPSGWALEGEASGADDVTEGWIRFETAIARGWGYIRLKGDRCWTLLTTMQELKGHEEARGPTRPKGVEHGALQNRKRSGSTAATCTSRATTPCSSRSS